MSDITERLLKWRDQPGYPTAGEMLDEAIAEIERLTAEAERHRMTPGEREAAHFCVVRLSPLFIGGVVGAYLDRTAPKET